MQENIRKENVQNIKGFDHYATGFEIPPELRKIINESEKEFLPWCSKAIFCVVDICSSNNADGEKRGSNCRTCCDARMETRFLRREAFHRLNWVPAALEFFYALFLTEE